LTRKYPGLQVKHWIVPEVEQVKQLSNAQLEFVMHLPLSRILGGVQVAQVLGWPVVHVAHEESQVVQVKAVEFQIYPVLHVRHLVVPSVFC